MKRQTQGKKVVFSLLLGILLVLSSLTSAFCVASMPPLPGCCNAEAIVISPSACKCPILRSYVKHYQKQMHRSMKVKKTLLIDQSPRAVSAHLVLWASLPSATFQGFTPALVASTKVAISSDSSPPPYFGDPRSLRAPPQSACSSLSA